ITTLLLQPTRDQFAGEIGVLTKLVRREKEAHDALGDAGALMGEYSVEAEEKAILKVLMRGCDLDDAVPTVQAARDANDDPFLALMLGGFDADEPEVVEHSQEQHPPTGLFPSDSAYLEAA